MLVPNSPWSRLQHIAKIYGERQPWVVVDTISVMAPTVGIENLEADLLHSVNRLWSEDAASAEWPPIYGLFDLHTLSPGLITLGGASPAGPEALALLLKWLEASKLLAGQHEADKIYPWVARELSRLAKAVHGPATRTRRGDGPTLSDYEEALDQLRRRGTAIAQWAKLNHVDINRLTLAEALEAVADFRVSREVRQGRVVHRFEDGWTVQELRTKRELKDEGDVMQHCVGGYAEAVENGEALIFSLRDEDGQPHVTLESDPREGGWEQIYGPQNQPPGPELSPKILEFLRAYGRTQTDADVGAILRFGIHADYLDLSGIWYGSVVESLSHASLDGARLDEAWFEDKYLSVSFRGASLREAALKGSFIGCDFTEASFDRAIFDSAQFRDCVFDKSAWAHGFLKNTRFTDCTFVGVEWSRSQWYSVTVNHCWLQDIGLVDSNLVKVKFADCVFARAEIRRVRGDEIRLLSCDLSEMDSVSVEALLSIAFDTEGSAF